MGPGPECVFLDKLHEEDIGRHHSLAENRGSEWWQASCIWP